LDDVVLGQKLGEGIKNNRMSDRMSDRWKRLYISSLDNLEWIVLSKYEVLC
jgi:hypothetical protein